MGKRKAKVTQSVSVAKKKKEDCEKKKTEKGVFTSIEFCKLLEDPLLYVKGTVL